ncbi:MAG: hypothetical protein ACFB4J_09710 [Elainellaceae cyanobacterium]
MIASPLSALKANAQLFESTPPEGADPAVTNEDTTDPDYNNAEAEVDMEMETDSDEMEAGASMQTESTEGETVSEEFDGEADGEGLSPRFEEENRETLNNG